VTGPAVPVPVSSRQLTGTNIFDLVVAGVLLLGGVRSLVRWMRTEFEPDAPGDRLLYLLYATARVGTWLAFATFFAGYALVDEPQQFRWFFLVPVVLAGVQLLTGLRLSRSRGAPAGGDGSNGGG